MSTLTGEDVWMHVYRLLEQNVEPHPALIRRAEHERGPLGGSFIHWLCLEGDPELIKALTQTAINLNAQNDLGNTALMEAAAAGRWDVAKVLRDAGADLNMRNHDGEDLLDFLELYGVEPPPDWS